MPSDIPSSIPSNQHSLLPSSMLSDIPSSVPSNERSLLTSSMPSDIHPSSSPSSSPNSSPRFIEDERSINDSSFSNMYNMFKMNMTIMYITVGSICFCFVILGLVILRRRSRNADSETGFFGMGKKYCGGNAENETGFFNAVKKYCEGNTRGNAESETGFFDTIANNFGYHCCHSDVISHGIFSDIDDEFIELGTSSDSLKFENFVKIKIKGKGKDTELMLVKEEPVE